MKHVYKIGPDLVVATAPAEALEVLAMHHGWTTAELREEYADADPMRLPDGKELTITDVDEPGQPKESRTCAEWANGGHTDTGFLGSQEYR